MAPTALPPIDIRSRAMQYTERTEGLHLSQITGDILIGMDPKKYGREDEDDGMWMNFLLGLIYERALELAWLDKELEGHRPGLIRPGEIVWVDPISGKNIYGTPDAFDTIKGRPEEYKFTKKSSRQPITDNKFWHYWVQLKAYAYMLGVNSGALYIMHVNGNNSKDFADPEGSYQIRGWEDTWTQVQLEENWAMLVNHARRRGWL